MRRQFLVGVSTAFVLLFGANSLIHATESTNLPKKAIVNASLQKSIIDDQLILFGYSKNYIATLSDSDKSKLLYLDKYLTRYKYPKDLILKTPLDAKDTWVNDYQVRDYEGHSVVAYKRDKVTGQLIERYNQQVKLGETEIIPETIDPADLILRTILSLKSTRTWVATTQAEWLTTRAGIDDDSKVTSWTSNVAPVHGSTRCTLYIWNDYSDSYMNDGTCAAYPALDATAGDAWDVGYPSFYSKYLVHTYRTISIPGSFHGTFKIYNGIATPKLSAGISVSLGWASASYTSAGGVDKAELTREFTY